MDDRHKTKLAELHSFWFGTSFGFPAKKYSDRWYSADPAFDGELRLRFLELCNEAIDVDGKLPAAYEDVEHLGEAVALILVYDQLPRNLFRYQKKAFAGDERALKLSLSLLDAEAQDIDYPDGSSRPGPKPYKRLQSFQQLFLFMPLMHSEKLDHQNRCLELFFDLWKHNTDTDQAEMFKFSFGYAEKHRAIIDRFGRFPHRNLALGRKSSPEELEYLKKADSFGQ